MANDHSAELLIQAELNMTVSIKNVNKQLREMAKYPLLNKLKIQIDIDKKIVKSLKDIVNSSKGLMEAFNVQAQAANNTAKAVEKVSTSVKRADGTIEKMTKTLYDNNNLITNNAQKQGKAADVAVKATKRQSDAMQEQRKTLKQMTKDLNDYQKTGVTVNRNKAGEVSSLTHRYTNNDTGQKLTINTDQKGVINNSKAVSDYVAAEKARTQALQAEGKTRKAIADANLSAEDKRYKEFIGQMRQNHANLLSDQEKFVARDKAHYQALQANARFDEARKAKAVAQDKLHYQALEDNRKFDEQRQASKIAADKKKYDDQVKLQQAYNKQMEDIQAGRVSKDKLHYQALQANADFDNKRRQVQVDREKLHYQALQDNANRNMKYQQTLADNEKRIAQSRTQYASNPKLINELNTLQQSPIGNFSQRNNTAQRLNGEIQAFQKYAQEYTKMQNTIKNAQTQYRNSNSVTSGLQGLQQQLNGLSGNSQQRIAQLAGMNEQFKQLTAGVNGARSSFKLFDGGLLSTAANMAKFQIAIMALYAPLNGIGSIINTVFDVDAQMTQLKRVLDDANDFNQILQNNIQIANELGRSIQDINEASIGFARMGFNSAQVENLTEVTGLLQNISDLKADQAINTLTTAMTVFNIEAGNSIDIADKLNEVDNNFGAICFAITLYGEMRESYYWA